MSIVSSPVGFEGMLYILYIAPVHEFKAAILMFDQGGLLKGNLIGVCL